MHCKWHSVWLVCGSRRDAAAQSPVVSRDFLPSSGRESGLTCRGPGRRCPSTGGRCGWLATPREAERLAPVRYNSSRCGGPCAAGSAGHGHRANLSTAAEGTYSRAMLLEGENGVGLELIVLGFEEGDAGDPRWIKFEVAVRAGSEKCRIRFSLLDSEAANLTLLVFYAKSPSNPAVVVGPSHTSIIRSPCTREVGEKPERISVLPFPATGPSGRTATKLAGG